MLPHAERTPWVPSKYAEGERRWGKHVRKGEILILEYPPYTLVKQ